MNRFYPCKLVWLIIICLPFAVTAQQRNIDSLTTLLKSDKEDTNKVNHLLGLAFDYDLQNEMATAIVYEDSAIALASKLNFLRGYVDGCTHLGGFYTELCNYPQAWNYFTLAKKSCEELHNKISTAILTFYIGKFYHTQDNYPKALEYYFDALKDIDNPNRIAKVNGNISVVYWKLGEYTKALNYDLKALDIYKQENDRYSIALTLGNMGAIYDSEKKIDTALDYYKQAMKIQVEIMDKIGTARNLLNIGAIYAHQGSFSIAQEDDQSALKIFEELDDKINAEVTLANIGVNYINEKEYKEAETYLLHAYDSAKSLGDMEGIKNDYEYLSDLYNAMGQPQKALDNYKLYIAARDSIINKEHSQEIGRIEAKAEFDKQLASQQAEADKKSALDETKNNRQKIFILLIAAIALASIAIAINIFRSLKTTRKQKLVAEKQKVEQELKALRAQMNPHFIFNAINSIKNVVLENDSAAASRHLSKFSKLMREVLENSKHEAIPLAKEIQMLELYMGLESLRFASKFTFTISVDNNLDTENILISPLIIQPYVENAIWHGLMHLQKPNGEVIIKIENVDDKFLKCIIEDNGIGREESIKMKQGKEHQSMGLSLTKDRVEILNSLHKNKMSVTFIDKKNADGSSSGTRVELFLPLIKEFS